MFCLRCGTEAPRLARECPVCGAPLSGPASASPDEVASTTRQNGAVVAPPAAAFSNAVNVQPSIGVGGLETPGPPRDALGRIIVAIAVALAADELLPWVAVNNVTYKALTEFGLPAVLLVVLLGFAVVPVFVPALRSHPVWSALPFAIGCLCLGFTCAVWLMLSPLTNLATVTSTGPGFSAVPSVVILPHWGLYLFVLGSLALIFAGQRLLQTAHETSDALSFATSPPVSGRQAAETGLVAPAAPQPTLATSVETAADGNANGATQDMASQPPGLSVPQPGSASWTQAPELPAPLRSKPTGPWRSQSISPRGR